MFKDILRQAWEAMLYNRRRTAITMVGMAGHRHVVLLLAYGNGFSRAIQAIFAQWGTQTIGVFPGTTSQQAAETRPACVSALPSMTSIASPPVLPESGTSRPPSPRMSRCRMTCISTPGRERRAPGYQDVLKLDIDQGRFFNGAEDQQRAHVCVIVRRQRPSSSPAMGPRESIRLNGSRSPSSASSSPKCRRPMTTSTARSISPSAPWRHQGHGLPGRNLFSYTATMNWREEPAPDLAAPTISAPRTTTPYTSRIS